MVGKPDLEQQLSATLSELQKLLKAISVFSVKQFEGDDDDIYCITRYGKGELTYMKNMINAAEELVQKFVQLIEQIKKGAESQTPSSPTLLSQPS